MTELNTSSMSEYLVGQGLVGDDKVKLKESAIIKRLLLIEEWWENKVSQRLSLILKSPVITRILFVKIIDSRLYLEQLGLGVSVTS